MGRTATDNGGDLILLYASILNPLPLSWASPSSRQLNESRPKMMWNMTMIPAYDKLIGINSLNGANGCWMDHVSIVRISPVTGSPRADRMGNVSDHGRTADRAVEIPAYHTVCPTPSLPLSSPVFFIASAFASDAEKL